MSRKTEPKPTLTVIGGPTGIGKTEIAVELATQCDGEIISADSMQVYRRLQIGTARPTPEECRGIPYHGVDLVEPSDQFHLGAFIELADRLIGEIAGRGRRPIVAGGTGLYIKGLLQGVFEAPAVDTEIRERLMARVGKEGPYPLYHELVQVDPEAAFGISPGDSIRIVRALELWEQTGKPISELWKRSRSAQSRYPYHLFVLNCDREVLYDRINRRVDRMFEAGLAGEVRQLVGEGVPPDCHAFKALGYRHVMEWLDGQIDEPVAREAMAKISRHYAKRQLTWFRAMTGAVWIETTGKSVKDIVAEIRQHIATEHPRTETWFKTGKK